MDRREGEERGQVRGREGKGGERRGREGGKEWAPTFGSSLRPCHRVCQVSFYCCYRHSTLEQCKMPTLLLMYVALTLVVVCCLVTHVICSQMARCMHGMAVGLCLCYFALDLTVNP